MRETVLEKTSVFDESRVCAGGKRKMNLNAKEREGNRNRNNEKMSSIIGG